MDKLLGVIGVLAAFLAGYAIAIAREPAGTDLQLIFGTICAFGSVAAIAGAAVLERLDRIKNINREPTP